MMNNVEPLTAEQVAELDPGIRVIVQWLRERGFDTCDSGDGSKAPTMECALPYPNVTMRVLPDELITETRRLRTMLVEICIDVVPITTDDTTMYSGELRPSGWCYNR